MFRVRGFRVSEFAFGELGFASVQGFRLPNYTGNEKSGILNEERATMKQFKTII